MITISDLKFDEDCYLKADDWHPYKPELTLKQIEDILDREGYTYEEKSNK